MDAKNETVSTLLIVAAVVVARRRLRTALRYQHHRAAGRAAWRAGYLGRVANCGGRHVILMQSTVDTVRERNLLALPTLDMYLPVTMVPTVPSMYCGIKLY